jgi:hypothetical protein
MTIQNDKLKQLISITPFEAPNTDIELDKLYRTPIKSGPTIVPNTGKVEKIYFNTKLNNNEIELLFNDLSWKNDYYTVFASGEDMAENCTYLLLLSTGGMKAMTIKLYDNIRFVWCNDAFVSGMGGMTGITKSGWQEFTNPIEINLNAQSSIRNGNIDDAILSVGLENNRLISLFSTTSFDNGGLKGYKYNQFVNGEWKELGNGGGSGGVSKEEVNALISEYMSANYDNLDEEEF